MQRRGVRWAGVCVLAAALVPGLAVAQAPAADTQHAERVAARADEDDVRLTLTAGSALTYGNARNFAVNLGGDFLVRMGQHAFTAQIQWVYGLASLRDTATMVFSPWADSANNLTWKLRYDFFITPDDALFIAHRGRRDPFAALEPRIGAQIGYARNFFREENHRMWGEIGYDFTYDHFPMALQVGVDDMNMPVLSTDRSLHSLRLFIGYENRLNEVLTYVTGLEALMRLDRPEHWRFEWINQLRSKLADWLQIGLDLTGRLDSLPPGQAEAWNEAPVQPTQMLDVLVTLNLVGTFDMFTAAAAEEEEEEECECEEATCPEPAAPEEPEATEPAPPPEADTAEVPEPPADEAAPEATEEPAADAP